MWTSKRFTSNFLLDSSKSLNKYYTESEFINKLYYYYVHNGFTNIITSQTVNILINVFTVMFVIFLYNCIDYQKIIHLKEDTELSEVVNIRKFFNLSLFFWIQLIIFFIIIFCKIVSILDDIVSFKATKEFYNKTLGIRDSDLNTCTWESILQKLKTYYNDDENIDAYFISNKIMNKDNYMIALIDKDIIKIDYLTTLLEWNIMYCIVFYLFDNDYKIKKNITTDKKGHIDRIKTRLRIVSFVNFLLMPFIIIFLIFYSLFEYSEKFYNSPKLINSRSFTLEAKWRFRYYNEIHHHFCERIEKAKECANEYMNQFQSKLLENISKLIIFLLSALFTILIFISILNENVLLHLYLSPNKTALWYIGIIATIITISKNFIIKKTVFFPKERMCDLREHIKFLPKKYESEDDINKVKKEFSRYFQYKVVILIKDIFYTLLVPFELYKLSYEVFDIVTFLQENTLRHNKIGRTLKLSLFDNIMGLDNSKGDLKTIQSYNNFKNNYKEWYNEIQSIHVSMSIT